MEPLASLFSEFTPAAYGIWAIFGAIVIWWIRGAPDRRRAATEADASLRGDLLGRIGALETQRTQDRKECLAEQELLHQRIREQEKLIDGLQRQLITFQITVAQALPPNQRSPEMEAMLDRIIPFIERGIA